MVDFVVSSLPLQLPPVVLHPLEPPSRPQIFIRFLNCHKSFHPSSSTQTATSRLVTHLPPLQPPDMKQNQVIKITFKFELQIKLTSYSMKCIFQPKD